MKLTIPAFNNTMNNGLLGYFENTWLEVGQFSPAMWSVLERDGNRTIITWRNGTANLIRPLVIGTL